MSTLVRSHPERRWRNSAVLMEMLLQQQQPRPQQAVHTGERQRQMERRGSHVSLTGAKLFSASWDVSHLFIELITHKKNTHQAKITLKNFFFCSFVFKLALFPVTFWEHLQEVNQKISAETQVISSNIYGSSCWILFILETPPLCTYYLLLCARRAFSFHASPFGTNAVTRVKIWANKWLEVTVGKSIFLNLISHISQFYSLPWFPFLTRSHINLFFLLFFLSFF